MDWQLLKPDTKVLGVYICKYGLGTRTGTLRYNGLHWEVVTKGGVYGPIIKAISEFTFLALMDGKDTKPKIKEKAPTKVTSGESNGNSKLDRIDVMNIVKMGRNGGSHDGIAKLFGIHRATVGKILSGKRWSHLTGIKKSNNNQSNE